MKKQLVKYISAILIAASLIVSPLANVSAATPDYIIISRDSLMALPTSGAAWDTIKSTADASVTPDICDLDNKVDVNALAAGIVYARTGDVAYRTKVINLINAMMATQKDGCPSAVLRLGRQIGGYVMAADFAGYRDDSFVTWLDFIIDHDVGGHGRWINLRATAYDGGGNWNVHALASTTTADIYLNRTADIEKDWQVFSSYGVPYRWPFRKTAGYNEEWSCLPTIEKGMLPIAINTPCIKSGIDLDGAPVEDASRAAFGTYSGYIQEPIQGFVVMAQLFNRTGRDGWTVNDSQVCRAVKFADRAGRLNGHNVSYFVAFMANPFCGLNLPTKTPTSGGRMFGFSDWLFSAPPPIGSSPTPTITSTATPTSTLIPTGNPGPTNIPTETPIATPTSAVSDLIFADGFESGNFSTWSYARTGAGNLSVGPLAALGGSNGLQSVIAGTTAMYVQDDSPNSEARYRARFYFDPNSLVMADGDYHYILVGFANSTNTPVLRVAFKNNSGAYQLQARILNNSAVWQGTPSISVTDAPHSIEVDWVAASAVGANDGYLTFWIDGIQQGSLVAIDNDSYRMERVRLGLVYSSARSTSGTYFFDAFESRRQNYIGP